MSAPHPNAPTGRFSFPCLDGHTCGNPVRLVTGGHPPLRGQSMSEKRQHFLQDYDWIRNALMFEPRGHDMMSGGFLYPPTRDDCDVAILFIETSGCLPMCGHGTIGLVTMGLENGLITPQSDGVVNLDTPAGKISATYEKSGPYVEKVRLTNIPSFLAAHDVRVQCPELGELVFDVAYGGNYYAIVEPQKNYTGLDDLSVDQILRLSPIIRRLANEAVQLTHPTDPTISGISHVQWTGKPHNPKAHGRNAVFYGDKAIDRSPCGTGTSARMAQLAAKGLLKVGDEFVHESIIGSMFEGRVEEALNLTYPDGTHVAAIRPSIAGWARQTGQNIIFVDDRDPFRHGFQVK